VQTWCYFLEFYGYTLDALLQFGGCGCLLVAGVGSADEQEVLQFIEHGCN
jgi:hypothetical protein